jgi:hypothetical protein
MSTGRHLTPIDLTLMGWGRVARGAPKGSRYENSRLDATTPLRSALNSMR